ncbi:MAG: YbaB/EbfC family nucleoid-associated protein [Candidatus Omnitrophota bacterium]
MFNKMKNVFELQKKANEVKKELNKISIENTALNGKIRVKVDGEFRIKDLEIDAEILSSENKDKLVVNLKNCINEAQNRAKTEVARKMKETMGDFNIPGF